MDISAIVDLDSRTACYDGIWLYKYMTIWLPGLLTDCYM